MKKIKRRTVHFPNSVGKILLLFVLISTRLFYIRSERFFQIGILQILLFQMIYCWSFIFRLFMVKSPVYEKYFHPTELEGSSLILSASKKMSLILRLLIKYMGKINLKKKSFFRSFLSEIKERCLQQFCRANEALS